MIRDYRAVREIANAIAEEANGVIDAYRRSRITDEPHITDRLMGAIESRVRNLGSGSHAHLGHAEAVQPAVSWEAMTLRSGPYSAAHEKENGADILGVFSADFPNYKISKGFLAQAKRAEPGQTFSRTEWDRLVAQCERMLNITSDAFVVAYSKNAGVRFFSALAVTALREHDMFQLYSMAPRSFFERHFESFLGDRRLDSPKISVLDRLRADESADVRPGAYVLGITVRLA
jgi:hypothetical protein